MRISVVAAVAENGVIGRDGRLPWKLPDESRFFQKLTTGHCLVMGRATFESIGKPLPRRTSIVLSRNPAYAAEGVIAVPDFESALAAARELGESETFVIGGAAIYALALPRADALYLTRVHAQVEGDVTFPELDESSWKLVSEKRHASDARHAVAFTMCEYTRAGA